MLKSNLKVAWRSLKGQPFFTTLNTFGLAVGMAGGLLISLFIYDELSFDKMFADSDRIYRINIDNKTAGEVTSYATAPGPMAAVVAEDCPQIEMVTRFRNVSSKLIRKVDAELNVKEIHVTGVDATFFDMFGLELLVGDEKTALKEPKSLVMTRTAAEKHFGVHEALGQSLLIDNKDVYIVTGVMDDLPKNSFLRDHHIFISIASFDDAQSIAWNTWSFPTFVKLHPAASPKDFQSFLDTVKDRYLIPWAMTFVPGLTVESARESEKTTGNYMKFNTTALTDIHLYSKDRDGEFSINGDIQNVYIMSIIGSFLILLASVNFMNLSTAQSLRRAKEVGIRKTLGSNRNGLVMQFLTEAGLVSFLALLLATVISAFAIPFFNELSGKAITIPFSNPVFWLVLISATAMLGLFSGAYPAFFMSNFVPARVLKGSGYSGGKGGGNIRNSLVVFQFSISVFLIVSTLVVFQQLTYIQSKDLGFQKDQILIIEDIYAAGNQVEVLKQEIQQISQVANASLSSYLPTPSARNGITFFRDGSFESTKAVIIGHWRVDYDYVPTLGLEIITGRNFDRQFATDSSSLLLNESALDMFEISAEEAIGMRLTKDFHRQDKENMEYLTVIGVVKNFHFESLRNSIDGLSFILGKNSNKMIVKLNTGDLSKSIESIEEAWNRVAPNQPFNYYFMDDSFNETYKAELRLGHLFVTFTILSIVIACLGLFGLAAFNAEKRIKEIGIRKVLGANVSQITYKLSIDFLKLVGVAIVVSLPLGWFAMNRWLEDFSYRIEIAWWVFALATFLAVAISIITVGYQSIRAALNSPVDSLRSE